MVEVLIVIAITVILFGLLIRPLVDTLRYTKDAQLEAAAQDSARQTMEILSREIGSAAYVSDNATYAFQATNGNLEYSSTPGVQTAQYSNFLNIPVPSINPATGALTTTGALAHLYNAKLDLVMARHQNSSTLTDPTAGGAPITITSKSLAGGQGNYITSTPLTFPLAPDTTIVRYFVGLKNPDDPYSNSRDHVQSTGNNASDNTYVLYRVQCNPETKVQGSSNYLLFPTNPTNGQPILDDPDFFRPVTTSDVNWLSPTHTTYSATDVALHNARYEQWKMIAKPIINAPEIDLLQLPHNYDRTIDYDSSSGEFPGIAHYGGDHDPVTGTDYPVEHVSVTFTPGAVSMDAAPSTTADYQERGIASGTNGLGPGMPYVPTVYQSEGQAWTRPYFVYLYPTSTNGQAIVNTYYYGITQALTTSGSVTAGDVVEYYYAPNAAPEALYDLTTNHIVVTTTTPHIIPATINEDQGTITFSEPAVVGAGNANQTTPSAFNRTWIYTPSTNTNAFIGTNVLDLTQNDDNNDVSPLNNYQTTSNGVQNTGKYLDYAFIVPGSLRVYGPDMTAGPGTYADQQAYQAGSQSSGTTTTLQPVLYTEVSANTIPGPNQYQVNYLSGQITFMPFDQFTAWPPGSQFQIIYDYQANMLPSTTTQAVSSSNPAYPFAVRVTYHSRDSIQASVGVRYIDSLGNAQDQLLSNAIQVGNINR